MSGANGATPLPIARGRIEDGDHRMAREGIEAYAREVGPDGDPLDPETFPYVLAARTLANGDGARPRERVECGSDGAVRVGLVTWAFPAWGPGRAELTYDGAGSVDGLDAFLSAARHRVGPGPDQGAPLFGGAGLGDRDDTLDPALPDGAIDGAREAELVDQTLGARELAGLSGLARLAVAGPERPMGVNDWYEAAHGAGGDGRSLVASTPAERAVALVAALAEDIAGGTRRGR